MDSSIDNICNMDLNLNDLILDYKKLNKILY